MLAGAWPAQASDIPVASASAVRFFITMSPEENEHAARLGAGEPRRALCCLVGLRVNRGLSELRHELVATVNFLGGLAQLLVVVL